MWQSFHEKQANHSHQILCILQAINALPPICYTKVFWQVLHLLRNNQMNQKLNRLKEEDVNCFKLSLTAGKKIELLQKNQELKFHYEIITLFI